jgi:putative toxin-antitoxin system antitoxin component (TIGR02293 family)
MSATPTLKRRAADPQKPEGVQNIRTAKINVEQLKSRSSHRDVLERIASIRVGIPAQDFETTAEKIGLSKKELAEKLGLSPRTISSRKNILSPEESEKTLRIQDIFEGATRVFGSAEEAQAWLNSPAYGLKNQRPIDLLDTDLGAQQVKGLLSAIKYGNVW